MIVRLLAAILRGLKAGAKAVTPSRPQRYRFTSPGRPDAPVVPRNPALPSRPRPEPKIIPPQGGSGTAPPRPVAPPPGLTADEKGVLTHLAVTWNVYGKLPYMHPADAKDFADAIHTAQRIIALRVARRTNPDVWSQ